MKSWQWAARAAVSIVGLAQLPPHGNVVAHRTGQQKRVLRHQPHIGAELVVAEVRQRNAIQRDAARLRRVEAQQQAQQRGLATAGVADQAIETTGWNVQRQIVQHHGAGS